MSSGMIAVLRAEEELFLQLGMAEGAEFLRDAVLFAVGAGIGRRDAAGLSLAQAGMRSGRKAETLTPAMARMPRTANDPRTIRFMI